MVGRVGDDIVDGLFVIACYYRVIIDCRVRRKTKIGGGEDGGVRPVGVLLRSHIPHE